MLDCYTRKDSYESYPLLIYTEIGGISSNWNHTICKWTKLHNFFCKQYKILGKKIISSYILIYFTYSFNTVDVFLNTLDIILIIKHNKLLINYILSTF